MATIDYEAYLHIVELILQYADKVTLLAVISTCPHATHTTIDHEAYPHIIDRILQHATKATRLAFSSTCRIQRRRITHVALHHDGSRFSFTTPNCMFGVDYRPGLVTVLDLGGRTVNYASFRRLKLWQRDSYRDLNTIRRAPPTVPPNLELMKNLFRLPDVDTLVDYIDFDRLADWHWRGINMHCCRSSHILHLRFTIGRDKPAHFPQFHLAYLRKICTQFTVVLWPVSEGDPPAPGTFCNVKVGLQKFIESLYFTRFQLQATVVAPTTDFVLVRVPATDNCSTVSYMSHEEWLATLGREKDTLGTWIPWPQIAGHASDCDA